MTGRPWSFDGDGTLFRLVSEAHRISLAHLFDPLYALDGGSARSQGGILLNRANAGKEQKVPVWRIIMPINAKERTTITLVCEYLSKQFGGQWKINDGPSLEDQHPSTLGGVPEVIISNGKLTAAIEVKELLGATATVDNMAWISDLEKTLIPSCGGEYYLHGIEYEDLPLSKLVVVQLQGEIERIARTWYGLSVFQTADVNVAALPGVRLERYSNEGRRVGIPNVYQVSDDADIVAKRLIEKGVKKFTRKEWADIHILALYHNSYLDDSVLSGVQKATNETRNVYENELHFIFLKIRQHIHEMWRNEARITALFPYPEA